MTSKNYAITPRTTSLDEIQILTKDVPYLFLFDINKIIYYIGSKDFQLVNIDDSFFEIGYNNLIEKLELLRLFQ